MSAAGAYGAAPGGRAGDELIVRHAELVKRIAYHLAGRLPPSVAVDDLIQAGMLGLMEAAANYTASRGASFETYAGIRIRGAMIDALRALDWAPRSVHRKARAAAAAQHRPQCARCGDRTADGSVARGISLHRAGRRQLPAGEPGR
jgi:RNA polymerase sigma factor FliA